MKVKYLTEVEAKETDTKGKNAYLVALCCGGIMEDPEIHYHNYQVIYADSDEEASCKYNELNQCNYYYGEVLSRIK